MSEHVLHNAAAAAPPKPKDEARRAKDSRTRPQFNILVSRQKRKQWLREMENRPDRLSAVRHQTHLRSHEVLVHNNSLSLIFLRFCRLPVYLFAY